MTTRTHQTLRVGLRKIIRDPRASIRTRLQAIRLLMDVEGLPTSTKNRPVSVAKMVQSVRNCKNCSKGRESKSRKRDYLTYPLLRRVSKSSIFLALISRTIWRTFRLTSKHDIIGLSAAIGDGSGGFHVQDAHRHVRVA